MRNTCTITSLLPHAVDIALRDAGRDVLDFRCTVLVDGIDTDGRPFMTAITTSDDPDDAPRIAAELVRKFADSPLAEI